MIESVFGAASARSFQKLWSGHIDDFVTYTQALATDDAALEATARERLERFNAHFATFLSTSTQGRLATPALADAFVMHEDLLFQQINAYAEQDYSTAHQVAYDAYTHVRCCGAGCDRDWGNHDGQESEGRSGNRRRRNGGVPHGSVTCAYDVS